MEMPLQGHPVLPRVVIYVQVVMQAIIKMEMSVNSVLGTRFNPILVRPRHLVLGAWQGSRLIRPILRVYGISVRVRKGIQVEI